MAPLSEHVGQAVALFAAGGVALPVAVADTAVAGVPPAVEVGKRVDVAVGVGVPLALVPVAVVVVVDIAVAVSSPWGAAVELAALRRAALLTPLLGLDWVLTDVLVRLADVVVVVVERAVADVLVATVAMLLVTRLALELLLVVVDDAVVDPAEEVVLDGALLVAA